MESVKFEELGLYPQLLRAIKEMGFEEATPIQAQAIPVVMSGVDVIGQAQTGTGKTASFGIPLLMKVDPNNKKTQAIVLSPTRELAIQSAEEIRKLAKYMHGIKVLPVYGGQDIGRQIKALKGGATIIIGTPGRIMDHLRRKTIRCDHVNTIVLDEADEMLNMGFREDIETILSYITNEDRQTVLFSATMPKPILDITKKYQKNATTIKVTKKELTVPNIDQYYYDVRRNDKVDVLTRLLDYYNPKLSLVFCNTKRMVDELASELQGRGYAAEGIHGDMKQQQRDRVMKSFRNGRCDILIATDVAARGENIWVAKNATVAETACLNGPLIIDEEAEIRHCAFVRGSAIIGKGSVVGNSTEIKNDIIFNSVQVPHYNYVGDSILGYKSHMGAGSITSNVKSDKTLVVVKDSRDSGEQIETGLKKFGAMLGDYVEVGCNSVLNPGTVIGRNCNVYPLSSVRGVIPAGHIFKDAQHVVKRDAK